MSTPSRRPPLWVFFIPTIIIIVVLAAFSGSNWWKVAIGVAVGVAVLVGAGAAFVAFYRKQISK